MAENQFKVYLGFDDEAITEKHKAQVNFTTNKLGGKPDWPSDSVTSPLCKLCGLSLPLVLQVYAPLEFSPYHRTLYVFACINANCWNQNESWVCFRSQTLDTSAKEQISRTPPGVTLSPSDWCADADDWDEDDENGNLAPIAHHIQISSECDDGARGASGEGVSSFNVRMNRNSPDSDDDADEVAGLEGQSTEVLSSHLGNLRLDGISQRDANFNAQWRQGRSEGARGCLHSPQATAEIEGDESELVTVDTPTDPQLDLRALLQESAPLPKDVRNLHFVPFFLSVFEEELSRAEPMTHHVRLLLAEYQQSQGQSLDADSDAQEAVGGCIGGGTEKYESSVPAHGDVLFHHFLERIQQSPGQLLRYCRDSGSPLPLAPLVEVPSKCSYCHGDMIFEMQVLPSIIPKLRLQDGDAIGTHVEFGTVLIWTCRESCWASGDNVREERLIVQAERF